MHLILRLMDFNRRGTQTLAFGDGKTKGVRGTGMEPACRERRRTPCRLSYASR
jgi:hypothetical protein